MCTEDSPSGLWRTLGKRVGCKPSGVRIPHPPPPDPGTCPGSGVFFAFAAKSPHRRGGALLQRIRVFPLVVELEGKNRGTKYEISTTRRGGRWGAFLLVLRVAPPDLRPPRGLPRRAGLLGVPVGGGPPALRAFGSARRLEARPGPAGLAAASNRAGLVVTSRQAPPPPTGTAARPRVSQLGRALRRPPHRRRLSCCEHRSQALTPPAGTAAGPNNSCMSHASTADRRQS